ncbi:hypothetical protein T265_10373 [Opisthorchis viverrini]|uniref:Uncharacterized protein n=1 Tax=Opisthorchis viverrini TaxID=6198 RepID=A0A074Z6R7_OPIVI|nr:hypothetical protein T265_10373 [Opisthorchis viverrini]KER21242.1 hypothetical protein T265_10373 [Opisthorchis viverrini]
MHHLKRLAHVDQYARCTANKRVSNRDQPVPNEELRWQTEVNVTGPFADKLKRTSHSRTLFTGTQTATDKCCTWQGTRGELFETKQASTWQHDGNARRLEKRIVRIEAMGGCLQQIVLIWSVEKCPRTETHKCNSSFDTSSRSNPGDHHRSLTG